MASGLVQPPPELAQAIRNSAVKYGVPADLLTGIWRVESGSSYPNPYVNSSGYGGLFGTADWNGPTQEQADLAASILLSSLKAEGGDIAQALSRYSGGGYTTVPGQVTFGTISGYGTGAPPPSTSRTRPETGPGGATGAGLFSDVGSTVTSAEKAFEGLYSGSFGSIFDVFKGIVWLLSPESWLRMVEFVMGAVLMLLGVIGLAAVFVRRSETVATVSEAAAILPGPAGKVGRVVTAASAPRRTVRRHRQAVERKRRGAMDRYYRERADELEPRRRARVEQRSLRQQMNRERRDDARAAAEMAGERHHRRQDEVPF